MKLKKIASLMLAGIMAVSMLAACGNANSNGGNGGEGEGEGTQTSGYSAVMAENVSKAVKDKDFVSFQDNTADQTALATSLNFVGKNSIADVVKNQKTPEVVDDDWGDDWNLMIKSIVKDLELDNQNMNAGDMDLYFFDGDDDDSSLTNESVKCGVVYAVDSAIGVDQAIQTIAENLSAQLAALDDEATTGKTTWYYDYTVSVSVDSKTAGDETANFILVTVDRTVTNA